MKKWPLDLVRISLYAPFLGAVTLSLGLWLCLASVAHALQVTDDRGTVITLAQPPARVVSLLPSLTETVCALDECQRLVGVDRYSNYPPSVQALPRVGGGLDPSMEAIVALKPDVVLMASSALGAQRLRALGISVLQLEPKTHTDVMRVMNVLAQLFATDTASALWQRINVDMDAAAHLVPFNAVGKKVYFEVSRGPFAAGESSFLGQTLQRLGLGNIVAASLGPFPQINPEWVVRSQPDFIMLGDSSFADLATRPGWSGLHALPRQQLCVFGSAESDILVRPGPRMAEGARLIAQCVKDKLKDKAP